MEIKMKEWGESCTSMTDLQFVFVSYIKGNIKKFPFSEGGLALETTDIKDLLISMNENRMFTINS